MNHEVNKLVEVYKEHGKIIVGCDFDDTIFPYTEVDDIKDRCKMVIDLIQSIRSEIILCLYSCDSPRNLRYKAHIMDLNGIKPDYIMESPVKITEYDTKPYFNILLDDKAGIHESIANLNQFKKQIL